MRYKSRLFIVVFVLSLMHAADIDANRLYDFLKKGTTLSTEQAANLEEKLRRNPADAEARVELLSFYTSRPSGVSLDDVKASRARLISWIVQNDPREGLGLFKIATGVYRLNCRGDELADPDAAMRVAGLWMEHLKKNAGDASVRRNALEAIQYCAPEEAEKILREAGDSTALGRFYGRAVLGVTGEGYTNNEPGATDSALRQSAFADKARRVLEESNNSDLVVAAAIVLLREGANLWADGKLDWDYTELGNKLLAKAKQLAPSSLTLLTLPTQLPARGERPPMTIRVGGNVQAAAVVRKVAPKYPAIAKERLIAGTVRMMALIGLDGRILALDPIGGPTELIPASLDAVRQWVYKPTLLNGKPCYVVTQIDVNFSFR